MTTGFWFGVAGSASLSKTDTSKSWWCVPYKATIGDSILLYCPRSMSVSRHGVFAEATVLTSPSDKSPKNCECSRYGYGRTALCFVEIEISQRFTQKLTAKQMKADPILSLAGFVRKNFQGTTFRLDPQFYRRIRMKLDKLAEDLK